ncbi:MAG: enolase C-terminal domain-like protein [Rhodothermales bacterium]
MTDIRYVNTTFEREPLVKPFGFKGGFLSDLWQTVVLLESSSGRSSIGLGTQSVLWSDSAVFATHSEAGGNALMFAVLEFAAQAACGRSFRTPLELLDGLFEEAREYAVRITERPDLRATFVLNALVALDHAAWLLCARDNGLGSFDEMIPEAYREPLLHRHDIVASVPAAGFSSTREDLLALADAGYFIIKVKLGHPGGPEEMLARDKRRIEEIHDVFGDRETAHTESGRIPYYLDINGRYDSISQLWELVEHADAVGVLDQIILVEEPFPEGYEADVSDLPVRIAADESAHTDADARRLIDMGYGAIALKPIAKTVSMTLKIAAEAHARGIPCFCADLTVNPILVEWNKCFAARLEPLPGLNVGLLETNGHQNYLDWDRMMGYNPAAGASWTEVKAGAFHLDSDFFAESGGLFESSSHYLNLVRPRHRSDAGR